MKKQECIPVGCVPPAAVAVSWGVCLSACWDTLPWVWAWRPPQVWARKSPPGLGLETPLGVGWRPPWVWVWRPPGCGPGDPPSVGLETPQVSPWVWAWKPARHAWIHPHGDLQGMLGYHLQAMLGYHPVSYIKLSVEYS